MRILLYADDGALVAQSADDLQHMLDALHAYRAKWRLFVNTDKTKVMVFNHTSRTHVWLQNKPVFTYNGTVLEIVDEFKYLDVLFHTHIRHTAALEHRLTQSKRLVAMWMRRCQVWCFKPHVAISMFKTSVMPALEYGVGLWGAGLHDSDAWEKIEVFWRYIARCILGVSSRAPNGGEYGELGWYPFYTRATWQASSFFTRITEMSDSSLVRQAMYVQRSLLESGKTCWLSIFKSTLCKTACGQECWDKWWSKHDFELKCERTEYDEQGRPCTTFRWEQDI